MSLASEGECKLQPSDHTLSSTRTFIEIMPAAAGDKSHVRATNHASACADILFITTPCDHDRPQESPLRNNAWPCCNIDAGYRTVTCNVCDDDRGLIKGEARESSAKNVRKRQRSVPLLRGIMAVSRIEAAGHLCLR